MEYLNGLDFVRKTTIEWCELDAIIKNTVNCDYIHFNKVECIEDSISISFSILDTSKIEVIKDSFKKFISEEDLKYTSMFEEIDFASNEDNISEIEIYVDKDVYLGIIESYLNITYNINIKVKYIEAYYENIGVIFEVKEKDR